MRAIPKRRKRESLTEWLGRILERAIEQHQVAEAFFLAETIVRIENLRREDANA